MCFWVIIPGFNIVEACLLIVIVASISERILFSDRLCQAARGGDKFPPAVIDIAYHLVAVTVKDSNNSILEIPDIIIGCSIVQESNEALGVIAEPKPLVNFWFAQTSGRGPEKYHRIARPATGQPVLLGCWRLTVILTLSYISPYKILLRIIDQFLLPYYWL